ncbi:hypothetical protein A200_07944 [Parascardovia denticolens IPLA 20019]|uniref:hypothetical protein n=1 Tax=Parascardovia denticolens TaxID=78258 RepID=UPI000266A3C0|nr:hypothetical protein [Parascardovia denticolens]EIT87597.1 hypothetical protein A200_07944 [Parascardovia denticolens IPLA 20019]
MSIKGRGYQGHSMSVNAANAYHHGEKPLSKWTKEAMLKAIRRTLKDDGDSYRMFATLTLPELKRLYLRTQGWHHTSGRYNRTGFYSLDRRRVHAVADRYRETGVWDETVEAEYDLTGWRGKDRVLDGLRQSGWAIASLDERTVSGVCVKEGREYSFRYDVRTRSVVLSPLG